MPGAAGGPLTVRSSRPHTPCGPAARPRAGPGRAGPQAFRTRPPTVPVQLPAPDLNNRLKY
eukprot:686372-Hanusia_phi.AAC.1